MLYTVIDIELRSLKDKFMLACLKGAVCSILTLLKHKNTIIRLQIFKKHVKLTYLFI